MLNQQRLEEALGRMLNLGGNYFLYYDHEAKRLLALDPIGPISRDQVYSAKAGEYAVCVPMRSQTGQSYDLDFILLGEDQPEVHGLSVHASDGIPRYQWVAAGSGYWRQRPYWQPQVSDYLATTECRELAG